MGGNKENGKSQEDETQEENEGSRKRGCERKSLKQLHLTAPCLRVCIYTVEERMGGAQPLIWTVAPPAPTAVDKCNRKWFKERWINVVEKSVIFGGQSLSARFRKHIFVWSEIG